MFNLLIRGIEKDLIESRYNLADEIQERKNAEEALLLSNEEIININVGLASAVGKIKNIMRGIIKHENYDSRFENTSLKHCWEVKNCNSTGCPSYRNSGNLRCWEVTGTFCEGDVQGTFAKKLRDCCRCEVYQSARMDSVNDMGETFNEMIMMISERELAVKESEERYRALFESAADANLLLENHEIFRLNDAAINMFEFSDDVEMTMLNLAELSPPTQPDGSNSSEALDRIFKESKEKGNSFFNWKFKRSNGEEFHAEVLVTSFNLQKHHLVQVSIRDITEQISAQEAISKSEMLFRTVISACQDGIIATNDKGVVKIFNNAAENMFMRTKDEMHTMPLKCLIPEEDLKKHPDGVLNFFRAGTVSELIDNTVEIKAKRSDGTIFPAELTLSVGRTKDDRFVFAVIRDITQRKAVEAELLQGQKLQSIGHLASGKAHEINTKTQFVGDNNSFLKDSFDDLNQLIEKYQMLASEIRDKEPENSLITEIDNTIKEIDLEFLSENIPDAIDQSLEGLGRVTKIVRAMKDFAHPEIVDMIPTDVNKIIESTVTVARNEWKYVADMELDLTEDLRRINCVPGEIGQVILNMIVNASHAIAAVVGDGDFQKGAIKISTREMGDNIEIRLSDTGTGIPEKIKERIFEPFFTTKEVGKGTGQGLAICHSVIVEKHKGTITFETESGKGTTFIITLPLNGVEAEGKANEETAAVR
ncbi:MAG: PAS domain S-box protein [bacterium]